MNTDNENSLVSFHVCTEVIPCENSTLSFNKSETDLLHHTVIQFAEYYQNYPSYTSYATSVRYY